MKRINVTLPDDLYELVVKAAEKRNTSKLDMIRRYIRLGCISEIPDVDIIIRRYGEDKIVEFL